MEMPDQGNGRAGGGREDGRRNNAMACGTTPGTRRNLDSLRALVDRLECRLIGLVSVLPVCVALRRCLSAPVVLIRARPDNPVAVGPPSCMGDIAGEPGSLLAKKSSYPFAARSCRSCSISAGERRYHCLSASP